MQARRQLNWIGGGTYVEVKLESLGMGSVSGYTKVYAKIVVFIGFLVENGGLGNIFQSNALQTGGKRPAEICRIECSSFHH